MPLHRKKDAQSHKPTKRYIPVEKKSDSKNHDKQIPIGKRFSLNKSSNVYLKTTPSRYGLTWKSTGRIFTQVGLKWIPIRKSVETRYNTNNSASPLGKETHNPKTIICANSSSLSAEHSSNTNVFTMKMEILLEPTSNKLLVDLPSRYQVYQGRLLVSFQDDAKYEHVGQDIRSQGGQDDQDKQGKYLKISDVKTKSKDKDKGSRSKITKHEGTSLQQDKDQDKDKSLTTKAISLSHEGVS
ncbi:hypothetical protein Tco_0290435 [Tanacetum coccineum]